MQLQDTSATIIKYRFNRNVKDSGVGTCMCKTMHVNYIGLEEVDFWHVESNLILMVQQLGQEHIQEEVSHFVVAGATSGLYVRSSALACSSLSIHVHGFLIHKSKFISQYYCVSTPSSLHKGSRLILGKPTIRWECYSQVIIILTEIVNII